MRKLIAIFIFTTLSINSYANCLPIIEEKIIVKEERLLFTKIKQKKVAVITGASVGGANAVFWGVMFKLIADGATIPASILVGGGFGVVTGATAVAAVGIPMLAYNQIIKAQIRRLKRSHGVIEAAESLDYEDENLKKLYRKVRRRVDNITIEDMVEKMRTANAELIFCPNDGKKILSFNKIKNYLRGESYDEIEASSEKIAIEIEGEIEELEFDMAMTE